MSASVRVRCDKCAATSEAAGVTLTKARALARPGGWKVSGGMDLCPDCWDAGWRFGRSGWTYG